MKKNLTKAFIILFFLLVIFYLAVIKPVSLELEKVRKMKIKNIDISQLENGIYIGNFLYGKNTNTALELEINNGEIKSIKYLEKGKTEYAQKAAKEIKERVLLKQSLNVDIVAGATTTSKAILKAMENAFEKGEGK